MDKVMLPKDVYTQILEEALRKMPYETGGILIGYWGSAGEAIITAVVGPGPNAKHRKGSFVPDDVYHKEQIDYHYQQSGRTEVYLGDWHTHPCAAAYLSDPDKATLKKIADFEQARLEKPLMMILGTKPFGLSIWAHTYVKRRCPKKPVIVTCNLEVY